MDRKLRIRILIIAFFLLFFVGVGVFFFTSLNARGRVAGINLYSLVPPGATAVLETTNLTQLMKELNYAGFSKELSSLKLSRIADDLRAHFDELTTSATHGLNERMNRMLISFHAPGSELDQVLYFCTDPGDEKWIERQILKYRPIDFPCKVSTYQGKTIEILPMGGDLFLCYYKSSGFVAASYSKRLIEQVIEAQTSGHSLLSDPLFALSRDQKRINSTASLYLKMKEVGWSELDLNFGRDAVYLSGISMDADTSSSFVNALKWQQPIERLSGKEFPPSTYYINQTAISEFQYIAANAARREYALADYADEVRETDISLMYFLKGNIAGSLTGISFYPADSVHRPLSLLAIPLNDSIKAETELQRWMQKALQQTGRPPGKVQLVYAGSKSYRMYPLPRNTVFSQLSGIKDADLNSYAVFYKNRLLLAPEPVNIISYITQVENRGEADGQELYKKYASRLAPGFNYLLIADLAKLSLSPESRSRLVPDFFFSHGGFFSHFILSTQFVCKERMVYPSLTLTYKDK